MSEIIPELQKISADALEKFARIHRSTIINIDRVKEMHPLFNGDQLVKMKNGKELVLSRNYRDRLKDLLESF